MAKTQAQLDALRRAYSEHSSVVRSGDKAEVSFRLTLTPEQKRRYDQAHQRALIRAAIQD